MAKKKREGIRELAPGRWLVQVTVNGRRKTKRVEGTLNDAKLAHAELLSVGSNMETHTSRRSTTTLPVSVGRSTGVTLKEFLRGRYAQRSGLLHKETTAKVFESQVRYLIFYLGDRALAEVAQPATLNWYTERRVQDAPLTFTLRKDGSPKKARAERCSNVAINKSLSVLRAALNLAFKEGLLDAPPRIELLPEDDATLLVPPTEAEVAGILKEAEGLRQAAPLLPEAIELSVETGLRQEELFRLTWRSVDFAAGPRGQGGAIRVEEQVRNRLVGGQKWVPKSRKFRIVPMSPRAREILTQLHEAPKPRPDELVIPNNEGTPYVRLQSASKGAGSSTWRVLKEAMSHTVRWHDLRHLFAIRHLQAGVPIAVVSQWMGHSDVNLTAKRYGRFSAEHHDQWRWMQAASRPVGEVVASRTKLHVLALARNADGN